MKNNARAALILLASFPAGFIATTHLIALNPEAMYPDRDFIFWLCVATVALALSALAPWERKL